MLTVVEKGSGVLVARLSGCHDFAWSRELWGLAAWSAARIVSWLLLAYLFLGYLLLAWLDASIADTNWVAAKGWYDLCCSLCPYGLHPLLYFLFTM